MLCVVIMMRGCRVMLMNVRELMAREYTLAEYYLLHYAEEQKRYLEELAEYLARERSEAGGCRSGVGDPTGVLAVKRVAFERESELYQWLDAVRSVESVLTAHEQKVLLWRRALDRGRYRKNGRGRPPWLVNVVTRFAAECDLGVSDHLVRKLWLNMVRLVVFAKQKRGV